ncbi:MAG: acyl carrier protein [Methylophilaceae bacterium]|nr:acyl carrier protein [Methylophilaceae bacterium]
MDTFEILREIILEKFEISQARITPETLLEDLGIDSLHAFDIIFEAEEKFAIKLTIEQAPIKTIQDVVDLIDKARLAQEA